MSAPPLKAAVRNCRKKRRWNDEITARAVALEEIETGTVRRLYVYRCPECHGWHLTRKSGGPRRLVVAGNPYPMAKPSQQRGPNHE